MNKLSTLLKQIKDSVERFKIEYEAKKTIGKIEDSSPLVDTKEEALCQLENAKKALKSFVEDESK